MLISLQADGFRSLNSFKLLLGEGINALVGPNGAGKSNVLTAFDFVSDIFNLSLSSAIRAVGGTEGVFSRKLDAQNADRIGQTAKFRLAGFLPPNRRDETTYIRYVYIFSIKRSRGFPKCTNQSLTLSTDRNNKVTPTLDVRQIGSSNRYRVIKINAAEIGATVFDEGDDKTLASTLADQLNRSDWENDTLLNRLAASFEVVYRVLRDIPQAARLNINPDFMREGDEIGDIGDLDPNGFGVVRILHALKHQTLPNVSKRNCEAIFDSIRSELKLAVESIADVEIDFDQLTGKYRLNFIVCNSNDERAIIPARLASDGTLKWLAIVTHVKLSNIFSLEEPENFLHPWMQRELIRLLRERCEDLRTFRVLITTHSETIINSLRVRELWIARMENGQTVINRPTNSKTIEAEINQSGFGLGHYYAAGAIEDEK